MNRAAILTAVYASAYVSERERVYRSGYYLGPSEEMRSDIADRAHAQATKVVEEAKAALERADKRAAEAIDAQH